MHGIKTLSEIISYEDFGELILDVYSYQYRMKILDELNPYHKSEKDYSLLRDTIISELKKISDDIFYINEAAFAVVHSDDSPESITVRAYGDVYEFLKRTVRFSGFSDSIGISQQYETERGHETINLRNIKSLDRFYLFDDVISERKNFIFDIYCCPRHPAVIEIHDRYGALAVDDFRDRAIYEISKFSPEIYRASYYLAFAVPYSEDHPDSVSVGIKEKEYIFTKRYLTIDVLYAPENNSVFITEAFRGNEKLSSGFYSIDEYYEGDVREIDSPESIAADRTVIYYPDGRGKTVNYYDENGMLVKTETFTENSFNCNSPVRVRFFYKDEIFEHLDITVSFTKIVIGYRTKKNIKLSDVKKIKIFIKAHDNYKHETLLGITVPEKKQGRIESDTDVPWDYPYNAFSFDIIKSAI